MPDHHTVLLTLRLPHRLYHTPARLGRSCAFSVSPHCNGGNIVTLRGLRKYPGEARHRRLVQPLASALSSDTVLHTKDEHVSVCHPCPGHRRPPPRWSPAWRPTRRPAPRVTRRIPRLAHPGSMHRDAAHVGGLFSVATASGAGSAGLKRLCSTISRSAAAEQAAGGRRRPCPRGGTVRLLCRHAAVHLCASLELPGVVCSDCILRNGMRRCL